MTHRQRQRDRSGQRRGVSGPPPKPWEMWDEHYYVLDPSDIVSLFQDTAKTSPVTADGQTVKAIELYDAVGTVFDTQSGETAGWIYRDGEHANAINSLPVLSFEGTEGASMLRTGAKQLQQYATDNLKFVYHYVFKMHTGATDNRAFTGPGSSGADGAPGSRFHTDSGGQIIVSGFMSGFMQDIIALTDLNPHLLTMECDGETGFLELFLDGNSEGAMDISGLGETELVEMLGASFHSCAHCSMHDGLDASLVAHMDDLIDHFGV